MSQSRYSRSWVLDEGGLVWEGGTRSKSMDKILYEVETAIAKWFDENSESQQLLVIHR